MIYITGDKHGDFKNFIFQMKQKNVGENDIIIILGDSCLNYYVGNESRRWKKELKKTKATFFIIRGNHEERPENIETYKTMEWNGGIVYYEEDFPTLLFAKDGDTFNFAGNKILVLGGAYSVDKFYRLARGYQWFADEQMKTEEMDYVLNKIEKENEYDYIFSHTAPLSMEPTELFLQQIDQSLVDKTMETFLEKVKEKCSYKIWYFGHYHADKSYGNFRLMYHDILKLGEM